MSFNDDELKRRQEDEKKKKEQRDQIAKKRRENDQKKKEARKAKERKLKKRKKFEEKQKKLQLETKRMMNRFKLEGMGAEGNAYEPSTSLSMGGIFGANTASRFGSSGSKENPLPPGAQMPGVELPDDGRNNPRQSVGFYGDVPKLKRKL